MKQYKNLYLEVLTKEVIPFWMHHAIDESGAINNCIREDGTVLSKDRYIWSQGRALWTFSALYNRIEKNPDYLKIADGLFSYLMKIGPDEHGNWNYLYDEHGNIKETDISIYVDGFVLAGMTEYYKATKNEDAKQIALRIYENTDRKLRTPGSYRVAPYVIPDGMKTHGVNMIFAYFYAQLAEAVESREIEDRAFALGCEILDAFYVPEKDAILEFVTEDGKFSDTPEGRSCVMGHVLESMWFLISMFEKKGDTERIKTCCRLIKRHFKLGWDKEKGGIRLAIDIDGKEPVFWQKPTCKPWWVHVEALVATAYAYKHTNDEWFMRAHETVKAFAFSHYPNGYGDWYNWLDENLEIAESAALPVKDPFHLPRALMELYKVLSE